MSHSTRGAHKLLERAGVYEGLQRLLGARRARARFVAEILRPTPGQSLLDIGCGTGSLLDDLPAGIEYVGLDLNERYVEAARRLHGARGTFVCARVEEVPAHELAARFDLVVAKGVLHHLDDAAVRQLAGVAHTALRPGGALVTLDGVRVARQNLVTRLLFAADRGRCIRSAAEYLDLLLPQFPDVKGWLYEDLVRRVPYTHWAMRAPKR